MRRQAITAAIERARRPGPPRLEVLGRAPARPRTAGLVAGSYDPMTEAHAALAEALDAELTLLVWSPATLPKESGPGGDPAPPLLEPEERIASMLAWCAARPGTGVAICSHGLLADQVQAAVTAFPGARLVLGVGSDKVLQLLDPGWYEDRDGALAGLFSQADVVYAVRRGDEERLRHVLAGEPSWANRFRRLDLHSEVAALSSRAVRLAVRRGQDVTHAVPAEVLPFVAAAVAR